MAEAPTKSIFEYFEPAIMRMPYTVLLTCCLVATTVLVTDAFMPASPMSREAVASGMLRTCPVRIRPAVRLQTRKTGPVMIGLEGGSTGSPKTEIYSGASTLPHGEYFCMLKYEIEQIDQSNRSFDYSAWPFSEIIDDNFRSMRVVSSVNPDPF